MADARPIGIFDSGLGGLTVFKEVDKLLPNEDLIYLGDNARVPYGGRSREVVTKFSFENAKFLLSKNVKCIVIACNTSSAFAGKELKKNLDVPVFDVISPAILHAKKITEGNKIGVIGTRGTIGSGAYKVRFSKACPLFVPFIEEGEIESAAFPIIIKSYLSDLKRDKISTLIMGCTHYPIIEKKIQKVMGNNVKLVNPGESVAVELSEYLKVHDMLNSQHKKGGRNYFVTDYTNRFVKMAEMFLGYVIKGRLKKVSIE